MLFNNSVWPWITITNVTRPLQTAKVKDEAYHVNCARYYLSQQYVPFTNWYRTCYATNWRYGIDSADAWGEAEDIQMWLGDQKNPTGRVALEFPVIRTMLTRMTGAVDNISLSAEAKSLTVQRANTRKAAELNRKLMYSQIAQAGPMMAGAIGEMGITPSEAQTEQDHQTNGVDDLVVGVNQLVGALAKKSDFDEKKRKVAENMALSGVAAARCSLHGQDLIWEICDPADIGWDSTALKPDFSDGEYVFTCPQMSVSAIAERWQPKAQMITALDQWSASAISNTNNFQMGWPQRRPRVFTVYWKDLEYVDRGFVLKDGIPHFCVVNKDNPDTGKPDYTDEDLIDPPENKWTRAWTQAERDAKKKRTATEIVRYCSFIPWEYFPGSYTAGLKFNEGEKLPHGQRSQVGAMGDMVFEWGEYELQETNPDQTYSVKFPIKFSAWSYLSGYAIAPITAAISPQRVMNQLTSDLMWRLNKAGGKSTIIDTDALAGSTMSEAEIITAQKNGDPYNLKGSINGGIQNAVRTEDTSPGAEFFNMFGLMPQMSMLAQSATGVYDQNYGAPGPQDQLVGVKQLQLQQAGVMQQPFYAAIANLFEQMHQFNAQAGKEYYSRVPWILSDMIGIEEMKAVEMSKDMLLEDFGVTVKLAPDGEQTKHYVDTVLIPTDLQLGLLDTVTAASLRGHSLPDDVYRASAKYTRQAQQAQAQAAQEQAKQQQLMMMGDARSAIDQQQSDLYSKAIDAGLKQEQIDQKRNAPIVQQAAEAEFNPKEPVGN